MTFVTGRSMRSSSGVRAQPSLTITSVWCELSGDVQDPFVIKAQRADRDRPGRAPYLRLAIRE